MNRAAFLVLAAALTYAAGKPKDWQTGRVVDIGAGPPSYAVTSAPDDVFGPRERVRAVPETQILLAGDSFSYIVVNPWPNAKWKFQKPCRFIVGDPVKYRQETKSNQLHLVDADGKECVAVIVRQERNAPKP